MPVFRRRKGSRPRLVPELDDVPLGRVRQRLGASWVRGELDTTVTAQVSRVIEDAGEDWDRKAHRLGVLAAAAGRALPGIWRRHQPHDQNALLLHAWSELVQAGRQGSSADLGEARATCLQAADLLPADPTPWVVYLATLRHERRPYQELSAVWKEIKARDPWNREAHLQALGYLSPDECGSTVQVVDLLDSIRYGMPADAPAAGLEMTSIVRGHQRAVATGGLAAISAGDHWRRPEVASVLDRAAQDWPRPGFFRHAAALADLNVLAFALVKSVRMDEAATALRATTGVATPWPWNAEGDPLERFSQQYERLAKTGS
ncbi:hypothetical protein [Streptomyces cucumeris]|uniref:hypothetical protein n=1 Tax=Streptomyces cucumeris TaxID=2962890 RepID=UPI0020C8D04A|nr:hypothetical protein [Streptomyces sp. NEAU-Y11]MCP9210027.1 hypothetical protein [Streptomyces sp. NEAU-Y11]